MLLLLLACLDHQPLPDEGEVYVAMQSDFAGFASWLAYDLDRADTGHPSGPGTVYLNAAPPAGADQFPVGTRLVKAIDGADLHAMAKRGGDFNPDGGGWEWFELVLDGADPVIRWRGAAPPSGEAYGALPGVTDDSAAPLGDCNTCHGMVADHDFVHTVGL